jgi:hypothetical protein
MILFETQQHHTLYMKNYLLLWVHLDCNETQSAQQNDVSTRSNKFNLNRILNVKRSHRNSLTPLSKVWTSLGPPSWN